MKCANCEAENPEEGVRCLGCGQPLRVACPQCRHLNASGNKFCSECGSALADAKPTAESHKVESRADRSASGERRQATVVFADVSAYTALNEHLDPEDVDAVISRFKETASRVFEKHGGTVNQFIGDEVLAVFGLPNAQEDDPVRAVRAAIQLHAEIRASSADSMPRIGRSLTLHTGINTGLVVAQRSEGREGLFRLTGDSVNLAARLRTEAKEDEILIGPNTQRLVKPYFEMVARPAVRVKGKAFPIVPYRIVAESQVRSRFDAARQRGLANHVGRQRELQTLRACLERACAGGGQIITIEGDAGVGKSRLLYEFLRGIDREEVTAPQGRCQAYGTDIPYFPFLDGLRRGLQLNERDSHEEALKKAVTNIKLLDPGLEAHLPLYLHLLSIPSHYSLPSELRGETLRQAMEEALVAIITHTTRVQPTVLVLEDWHWSDPASQSALQRLMPLVCNYRLVVAVSYRTGYGLDFGDLAYHRAIRLNPLTQAETENLLKNVIGADELPAGLSTVIHRSTEGNPLFVEEACYSLIESQSIAVREGQVIMHRSLEQLLLPDTVQAVIRARLDRLDHDAKHVVGLASVVGRTFSGRIIARVCGGRPFKQALETLQAQEIIRQARMLPDAEYTFRHILAREVAYDALLHRQRKKLHEEVGAAIEAIHEDRIDQYAAILAYHYARSTRADKAIEFSLLAGDQAAGIYANAEAQTHYEDALNIARTLPASAEAQRWQIDATLKQVAVGTAARDLEVDLKNLEQACALAEALDDLPRLAKTLYWLGRTYYVLARLEPAIENAQRSLRVAEVLGDPELAAPPVNLMGRAYWQLSDFARSAEMTELSVEQMRKLGNKSEESTAAGFVSALFGYMGQFDKAIAYSDRSIELARQLDNPYAEAASFHYRGIIRDQQGDWQAAIEDYQEAERIAELAGDSFRFYIAKFMEGRAYTMLGDRIRARRAIDTSLALARQLGTTFLLGQAKTSLVECLLAEGEVNEVQSVCNEAIELASKAGDKFTQALARRALAESLYRSGRAEDLAEARSAMLDAEEALRAMGARPELARTRVTCACVLAAEGRHADAMAYLKDAASLFHELRMAWDQVRLERVRSQLGNAR
jgi:class 3 adenylate cyclase/tetratricopeptide (TPR) repeat protein